MNSQKNRGGKPAGGAIVPLMLFITWHPSATGLATQNWVAGAVMSISGLLCISFVKAVRSVVNILKPLSERSSVWLEHLLWEYKLLSARELWCKCFGN